MNTYIVCYDIHDAKRLRKMHKTMKGFGDAIQYSIFKCSLSPKNYQIMLTRVYEILVPKEDRVMILDIGPSDGQWKKKVTLLGRKEEFIEEERIFVF